MMTPRRASMARRTHALQNYTRIIAGRRRSVDDCMNRGSAVTTLSSHGRVSRRDQTGCARCSQRAGHRGRRRTEPGLLPTSWPSACTTAAGVASICNRSVINDRTAGSAAIVPRVELRQPGEHTRAGCSLLQWRRRAARRRSGAPGATPLTPLPQSDRWRRTRPESLFERASGRADQEAGWPMRRAADRAAQVRVVTASAGGSQ